MWGPGSDLVCKRVLLRPGWVRRDPGEVELTTHRPPPPSVVETGEVSGSVRLTVGSRRNRRSPRSGTGPGGPRGNLPQGETGLGLGPTPPPVSTPQGLNVPRVVGGRVVLGGAVVQGPPGPRQVVHGRGTGPTGWIGGWSVRVPVPSGRPSAPPDFLSEFLPFLRTGLRGRDTLLGVTVRTEVQGRDGRTDTPEPVQ